MWRNLFITFPFLLLILYSLYGAWADSEIAKRQKTTIARIDAHDPPNHDRYEYIYSVDGKTYSGWEIPDDKHDFLVGEQLTVYYDPIDPSRSALVDFDEAALKAFAPVPMCGVLVLGFVLLIFFLRREHRRNHPLNISHQ